MPRSNAGPTPDTAAGSHAADDTSARRARGISLIAGAILIVTLIDIETETIAFYWFPALTGLTYLAAAAAGAAAAPCGARLRHNQRRHRRGAVAARRPDARQLPVPGAGRHGARRCDRELPDSSASAFQPDTSVVEQ